MSSFDSPFLTTCFLTEDERAEYLFASKEEKSIFIYKLSRKFFLQELLKCFDMTAKEISECILLGKSLSPKEEVVPILEEPDHIRNFSLMVTRKEKGHLIRRLRKTFKVEEILKILQIDYDFYRKCYMASACDFKKPKQKKEETVLKILSHKIKSFQERGAVDHIITVEDFIKKFGETPSCYLTGKQINLKDSKSYVLDHFIPVSKGGTGNLENMRPCDPLVNIMKWNSLYEDFIQICENVCEHSKSLSNPSKK